MAKKQNNYKTIFIVHKQNTENISIYVLQKTHTHVTKHMNLKQP
jgi:hypothetical protein